MRYLTIKTEERRKYLYEKFWSKLDVLRGLTDETGCWYAKIWHNNEGYPIINVGKQRNMLAHRLAYLLYKGDIPFNMEICHTCDNRACVNPQHQFLGTRKDNRQDAIKKGRFPRGLRHVNSSIEKKEDLIEIKRLCSLKIKQSKIAKKFGIAQATVSRINTNKRYKYEWE